MYTLLALLLLAVSSSALGIGVVFKNNEQLNKGYVYFNGQNFTVDEALQQCQVNNMTIVEPRTPGEAQWLAVNFNLDSNFWIGLQKANQALPQRWLDGSEVTEYWWANLAADRDHLWPCTAATADADIGHWHTANCESEKWLLICERTFPAVAVKNECDELKKQVDNLDKENDSLRNAIAYKNMQTNMLVRDKMILTQQVKILSRAVEDLVKPRELRYQDN